MRFLGAKYAKNVAAEAPPWTQLWELTVLPHTP